MLQFPDHLFFCIRYQSSDSRDLTLSVLPQQIIPKQTKMSSDVRRHSAPPYTTQQKNHLHDRHHVGQQSDKSLSLYGGIDSDDVTIRLTEPNGVMAAVGVRMATMHPAKPLRLILFYHKHNVACFRMKHHMNHIPTMASISHKPKKPSKEHTASL